MPSLKTFHLESPDKNNLLSLNEYLEDHYYNLWFAPGDFTTTTATDGVSTSISSIEFSDAGLEIVAATKRRPTYWINGYTETTVWWSVTSTGGNVRFLLRLYTNTEGSADSQLWAVAPVETPSSTNLASYTYKETSSPIITDHDLLTVYFARNGTNVLDTSTSDIFLHGINVRYVPINLQ